jgi:hypothetical protein
MAAEDIPSDDADQGWVQAMADQADAIRAAVDALEALMLKKIEESPFDPEVQALETQVKELRKIYPRIEE